MKKILILISFLSVLLLLFFGLIIYKKSELISPLVKNYVSPTPLPLIKYTYENLKQKTYIGGDITLGEEISQKDSFISRVFYYKSEGKKVSGLINFPNKSGTFPVILMFRGYIPLENYYPGNGTSHAGEVFAQNGFITLAPDFLGYGESASPSANPMEERFETYTAALNLTSSVTNINKALEGSGAKADTEKIGIWGHSNGGQIALSVLEISGKSYPTVLWAPVSKPFPYSILYYTDDIDDHGKALRRVVANFEKDYDSEKYSLTNYLEWIKAPIELHQGGDDEAVPQKWSDDLYKKLKDLDKDIKYYTYPGDDHNFSQGSWNTVVARNMEFYRKYFSPK